MLTRHTLKPDITFTQDLSKDALSYTTSVSRQFKLEEVIVQASVAITETITVTRDSKQGAAYDQILAKHTLSAEQSFVFRPEGECNFLDGDEVKVQCTDANGTGIVYGTLKSSVM